MEQREKDFGESRFVDGKATVRGGVVFVMVCGYSTGSVPKKCEHRGEREILSAFDLARESTRRFFICAGGNTAATIPRREGVFRKAAGITAPRPISNHPL